MPSLKKRQLKIGQGLRGRNLSKIYHAQKDEEEGLDRVARRGVPTSENLFPEYLNYKLHIRQAVVTHTFIFSNQKAEAEASL